MASYFWVGGTGTYDGTTNHFATSSGGVASVAAPTSADTVTFDNLSNATAYTVTISALLSCSDLSIGAPLSGKITFAGSSGIDVYGSLAMPGGTAGITYSNTGTLNFRATATGKTISTNGVTITSRTTVGAVGGGWTLSDAYNCSSNSSWTFTDGTFDTGGFAWTSTAQVNTFTGTRTLNLNGSTITVGGWSMQNGTTTINAGTSSITCNGNFDNTSVTGSYNNFTISGNAFFVTGPATYANLTVSSPSGELAFQGGTHTVTSTFTSNGSNINNGRNIIASGTKGTAATISAAIVSISNTDFMDITGSGAGTWSGTSIGDGGGNTGITFTTPVTRYWVAFSGGNWEATSSWSASNGGASGATVPLCHDTANITSLSITSGARTINVGLGVRTLAKVVDFTGVLNTPIFNLQTQSASSTIGLTNGNLTFVGGMTCATNNGTSFYVGGRSALTLTSSASLTIEFPMQIVALIGTAVTQSGDLVLGVTRNFNLSTGSYNLNGNNLTTGTFQSTSGQTRTLTMGSGTITLTTTSTTTCWNTSNGSSLTLTANTSTIKITGSTTNVRTFTGGGKTFNNLWFSNATASGFLTISDTNTFNDFKVDTGNIQTIKFTAAINVTVTTFTVIGAASNLIVLDSTTTGTYTLTKAGGGIISCDYLNIQHCLAKPGAWYAGANSTNNQGTTTAGSGWVFTVPPVPNRSYQLNQAVNRANNF